MTFRFASEPPNGLTLVRAGLDRLTGRVSPFSERGIELNALRVNPPHAVYDLHADEIANGRGLASAHLTGFRYLVLAAGQPVAAAEVHTDYSGTVSLLANVDFGPLWRPVPHSTN
jgi:hypothetical protein